MKTSRICLFSVLFLTLCTTLSAQNLAKLSKAPEVTVGQFPNGITYYLVRPPTATPTTPWCRRAGRKK